MVLAWLQTHQRDFVDGVGDILDEDWLHTGAATIDDWNTWEQLKYIDMKKQQ